MFGKWFLQKPGGLSRKFWLGLKAACEAFGKKRSAVEEEIYQLRNRSNQDPLNFPIRRKKNQSGRGCIIPDIGDG
jgi:hypothetical protein